jgi:hypothetical protein
MLSDLHITIAYSSFACVDEIDPTQSDPRHSVMALQRDLGALSQERITAHNFIQLLSY